MNSLTLFLTRTSLRISRKRKLRFDIVIMIVGIVLSVAVVSAAVSLFEGYRQTLKNVFLDSNSHIVISNASNQLISPEAVNQVIVQIKTYPEIKSILPTFSNSIMVKANGKIRSGIVKAYPANREQYWYTPLIIRGKASPIKHSVIIGEKLAEDLALQVNESAGLLFSRADNLSPAGLIPQQQDFKVSAILKTGYYELDKSLVIMNDQDAFDFYGTLPGYTHIEVNLKSRYLDATTKLTGNIKRAVGHHFQVQNWIDVNGNLFALIEVEKWLLFIVFCFLILLAAINSISTVSTSILDRKNDLAVLKTLGTRPQQLETIVFFRVLSIGTISILMGLLTGAIAAWMITQQTFYQIKGEVYFIDSLSLRIDAWDFLITFLVALLMLIVCIRMPLKSIKKLDIVEILRGT